MPLFTKGVIEMGLLLDGLHLSPLLDILVILTLSIIKIFIDKGSQKIATSSPEFSEAPSIKL